MKKIDGDVVIKDKSGILMRGSIIDNCFIPREDLKSKSFPVSSEELENMAIRLTQPKENHNNGEPELLSSGGYPHGSIKVINDKGAAVGVPGVKVRARYFLKWKHAYTNADGYFSFSSKFRKDPCMSIVFENSKGFTVWGNWAFLAAAHHTIGKSSPSQNLIYVKSRSEGRNYWDWSVISRSSYDYYTSCSDASGLLYGVQAPPSNMKIWCIGNASEMASTPMARHLKVAKTLSAEATMIAFCTNCLALKVASGIISFALHIALPDMFIGTQEMKYEELYLRMFHEFSHASHFQQIGEWKWGDVIWYEMLHKGYGKTKDNSRGEDYVELTESYSYAMQNYVNYKLFNPWIDYRYYYGRKDKFFKVNTWHLSNLLIEDVIAPSAMSRALNGACHINDLDKNLYMYNGGKTVQLNNEFVKKEIPEDL